MLLYHHQRLLEHSLPEEIKAECLTKSLPEPDCKDWDKCFDWPIDSAEEHFHNALDYQPAYQWLEDRVGFWPIWLSVGRVNSNSTLNMTSYLAQFSEVYPTPPRILFSWEDMNPVFLAYTNWHIVLNCICYPKADELHKRRTLYEVPRGYEKRILRSSWPKKKWIKEALNNLDVQAVVPSLDLGSADSIRCPDVEAKEDLIQRGFDEKKILVRRYPSSG